MARDVKLPEISENIDEATVVSILVSEGDEVEEEQALLEIETDKAVSELPSPAAGTIGKIKVKEGDEIRIGSVVLTLEEKDDKREDERSPSDKDNEKEEKETPDKKDKKSDEKDSSEDREERKDRDEVEEKKKEKKKEKESGSEDDDREKKSESSIDTEDKLVAASPSVRRFAREIGVQITEVEGTGPGNRILVDDVKAYAKERLEGSTASGMGAMGIELPDFSKWGDIERQPLSKVRTITADNTWKSWNANPHVTQFDKADITGLDTFRNKYSKSVEAAGGKLTVTAILLKITGFALQQFPRFNSSLDLKNKEIIHKKYIHVGVAVDTDRGLLVPVVRDVNKKSLTDLAVELGELAEKARNKKIKPEELEGGNFVISNLGGIGGTNFTPVIFPPQAAIMGVARAEVQPVYKNEDFEPRLMLPLNVSYDHKLIDGADGARFLRWICEVLENPLAMFLRNKI